MRALVPVLTAGAVALAVAPAARADDPAAAARQHYLAGTKAFDVGLYEEAIKEFTSAYQLKDDPVLLYDLAQAHRLAQHRADALRTYRRYLERAPNARNRQDVEARIAELTRAEQAAANKPSTMTHDGATAGVAAAAPARSGRGERIAGVALAGLGAAALAGGIVAGAYAQNESDALTEAASVPRPWDPAADAAGRRDQILEGVFLGIGATAVAVGTTLFWLGHGRDRRWTIGRR